MNRQQATGNRHLEQGKSKKLKGKSVVNLFKQIHHPFTFFPLPFNLPSCPVVGCLLFLGCRFVLASGEPDAFALSPIGARAAGMGGAFIGVSDDLESIYYNPAGLGNLKQSGLTAMYQTPSLQTSRGFVAANKAWSHPSYSGSVAVGWLRLRSADIELTSTDEKILGTDNLTNDLVMAGVGIHPFEHISLGMALKYFRFAFNGFSESGFGFDLGVHAQYEYLRFGLSWTDVGGTILKGSSVDLAQGDIKDKVPSRFRPGFAITWKEPLSLPVTFNLVTDTLIKLQGEQEIRVFTGGEVWGFQDRAALRSGFHQGVGPAFGAGARIGIFQFDYSYLLSLHLHDEHRLGTTIRF